MVKASGLTGEELSILGASRGVGVCGTVGGAVKCVEIHRNAGGESDGLDTF